MSAIWGAIDLQGNPIKGEQRKILRKAFDKCVIDRYEELYCENVYMGCGIQYFTPEAKEEVLPKKQENIFFTADVVLDNRQELCEKLNISLEESKNMPDGEILYEAYKKYGKSCLNDLLGAYTFVWYDKQKNEIELISDAVGNRCLYYRLIGSILYLSSLIEPLAQISDETKTNDRWLVDFLAMDHLFMVNETEETPIQDIYRVAPAQYIRVSKERVEKEAYWKPFENYQEYHFKSDEEYKKRFRVLWDKSVKDVMRTDTETAILLSGGLDSTAVAAVAAPYLKEKKKKLFSYTSVPMKGYEYNKEGDAVEDETEDVLKTAEFYGNIETDFVDLEGKTPWELMQAEFTHLEIPFKSVQNCLWLEDSMRRAYDKGARLILTGSYGNTSISFTNLNVYMNTLFKQNKFGKLRREVKQFANTMGFDAKYAYKQIFHDSKQVYEKNIYPYRNSFVIREMAEELGTEERLSAMERDIVETSKSFEAYRSNFVLFLAMRQIGEIETKQSLATGVLVRDPTKDKRVIEFCIHLPMEQFCKEGIDRRLVKVYLKEIMPPHVFSFQKKGKQSADLQYRFCQNNWEMIRQEWIQIYDTYAQSRYVDTAYAKRQLIEKTDCHEYTAFDLVRHMYTIQVLQYEVYMIKKYSSEKQEERLEKQANEQKPLISVIIPVYNVKEFLGCCVKSVCEQTYQNLEIILIDDGSTDGSGELCDYLAKKDARIHAIHKKNAGVAKARNTGLDVATGELIAFVDSDDWIEPGMYAKMFELMEEQKADLVFCGYRKIMQDKILNFSKNRVRVFYGKELLDTYLTGHDLCLLTPAVWNRLYKREMIGDVRFAEIYKYEDCVFNAQIMPKSRKSVYIDKAYYNYRMCTSSLTHEKESQADVESFVYANCEQEKWVTCQLSESSIRKNQLNYYCLLLDIYCKIRGKSDMANARKLLKQEFCRIRKEARFGIFEKMEISMKDQVQLFASTYILESYFLIEKIRKRNKI